MEHTIAIYGAQMVAVSIYYAVRTLYRDIKIRCFIVKDMAGNPSSIDGIPVIELEQFQEKGMMIVIATPENHHAIIRADLEKRGLCYYECMDSRKEAALMERYYKETGLFEILRSCPTGDKKAGLSVCMSVSRWDQQLGNEYHAPGWIHRVQAGAALTEAYVGELRDCEGENISRKNGNYCELTALYWAWKHMSADYLGLFHYRRILDIGEEDLYRLEENKIDAVLPYPTVQHPCAWEHHKRYLQGSDWEAMERALRECAPDYAEALPEIFSEQYFYNYNMLIARKDIFKDFCGWLFRILERTEELSTPKGSERADRYIGYLGESLTTLYFMYHKTDYRIVHTGRRMLL